eukprot:296851_1
MLFFVFCFCLFKSIHTGVDRVVSEVLACHHNVTDSQHLRMNNEKQNNDKETISRLREALANMNKDYMQTKLELDQMKGSQTVSSIATAQKADLGGHLLKFSSKMKAFQSNINTKLATAGIQINNLSNENGSINENDIEANEIEMDATTETNTNTNTNSDKEIRRLRDDIESLQTQIKQLKTMLKQTMEDKDGLQKERNELLIKCGEADEQIKRLKEQSIGDANRYEQLLDSFRAENTSQIEIEKKKLYKECDDKINALNASCTAYKQKYEELQNKWQENEEAWNNKFDLIVTERNSLKRKVKSLQNDLSEFIKHDNRSDNKFEQEQEQEEEEELKIDHDRKTKHIEELKIEIIELKRTYETEKMSLINTIQRLSSKAHVHSKGSNMQFLVNSLSALITEKEEIIDSLTQSKRYLGHRVIELEKK